MDNIKIPNMPFIQFINWTNSTNKVIYIVLEGPTSVKDLAPLFLYLRALTGTGDLPVLSFSSSLNYSSWLPAMEKSWFTSIIPAKKKKRTCCNSNKITTLKWSRIFRSSEE